MGFSLGGALVLNCAAKDKSINKVIAVSAPTCFEKIENKEKIAMALRCGDFFFAVEIYLE